jgi:hypothetical protein
VLAVRLEQLLQQIMEQMEIIVFSMPQLLREVQEILSLLVVGLVVVAIRPASAAVAEEEEVISLLEDHQELVKEMMAASQILTAVKHPLVVVVLEVRHSDKVRPVAWAGTESHLIFQDNVKLTPVVEEAQFLALLSLVVEQDLAVVVMEDTEQAA